MANNFLKLVLVIIILVIAGFGGYAFLTRETSLDAGSFEVVEVNGGANGTGAAILQSLDELRLITLDTELFNDPRFVVLEDFSVTLPDQPMGRANPFAPLRSGVTSTTTSSSVTAPRR